MEVLTVKDQIARAMGVSGALYIAIPTTHINEHFKLPTTTVLAPTPDLAIAEMVSDRLDNDTDGLLHLFHWTILSGGIDVTDEFETVVHFESNEAYADYFQTIKPTIDMITLFRIQPRYNDDIMKMCTADLDELAPFGFMGNILMTEPTIYHEHYHINQITVNCVSRNFGCRFMPLQVDATRCIGEDTMKPINFNERIIGTWRGNYIPPSNETGLTPWRLDD